MARVAVGPRHFWQVGVLALNSSNQTGSPRAPGDLKGDCHSGIQSSALQRGRFVDLWGLEIKSLW